MTRTVADCMECKQQQPAWVGIAARAYQSQIETDLRSSSWSVDFRMPVSSCSADKAPFVCRATKTVISESWSFCLVTSNSLSIPVLMICGTNSAQASQGECTAERPAMQRADGNQRSRLQLEAGSRSYMQLAIMFMLLPCTIVDLH